MQTEFSEEQFRSIYPDGIEFHWWSLARNKITANIIQRFAGSKASILEIGCGRGIVVKSLRNAEFNCFGVDLAPVRPIQGAETYVWTGIEASQLTDKVRQSYDTVLLLDVVEHIAEPIDFLKEIAVAFPNVSHVIVTVPARQELWSNYDEFNGHYRRYTPDMLAELSHHLGWTLAWKSYFFKAVYLPAWFLIRKMKQKRKTRLEGPKGLSRLMHRIIAGCMVIDYQWLPGSIPGTSLVGYFRIER